MESKPASICLLGAFILFTMCSVSSGQNAVPLDQAVNEAKVKVEVSGLGGSTGDAILIVIQRQVPETLRISLRPGTVFKSTSGTVQNMVGARIKGERAGESSYAPATEIVLTDDAKHSYIVEAYCLDFHKANPGIGDSFALSPPDEKAGSILMAGKNAEASVPAIQAALWIDRDGIGDAELKERFPVSDEDIKAARALLRSESRPKEKMQDDKAAEDLSKSLRGNDLGSRLWAWLVEKEGKFIHLYHVEKGFGNLDSQKFTARLERPIDESTLRAQWGEPSEEQKATRETTACFPSMSESPFPISRVPGDKVLRYGTVRLLVDRGKIVQAAKFEK